MKVATAVHPTARLTAGGNNLDGGVMRRTNIPEEPVLRQKREIGAAPHSFDAGILTHENKIKLTVKNLAALPPLNFKQYDPKKGLALFAKTDIGANIPVCFYGGKTIKSVNPPAGDCVLLKANTWIARPERVTTGKEVCAWVANSVGGGKERFNCRLVVDNLRTYAYLKSTRKIAAGDELLVSYGPQHPWKKRYGIEPPAARPPAYVAKQDRKRGRPPLTRKFSRATRADRHKQGL